MVLRSYNVNTARITRIQENITRFETIRDALFTAYTAGATEIESFALDTGETGEQRTKFRSLKELGDEMDRVNSALNRLYASLSRSGISNIVLRRRPWGPFVPGRNF